MPRIAPRGFDFEQPDLNGVPLSAIERIETLTGTAGGIYGPSALGGVVNVVLRRDYRGADLHVTSGITSRGDAEYLRVEGRIGFTPNDGDTDVMLLASHHMSEPLLAGQRDYRLEARRRQFANDPAAYLGRRESGNSVTVYSLRNRDLVLDPALGGGSIGAPYTYLPLGFSGTRAEAIELLRQNAGRVDVELPEDRTGAFEYVASTATVTSALLNVRQRLSDNIEAFVDGLAYRNRGSFTTSSLGVSPDVVADASNNPFSDPVTFRFPLPGMARNVRDTVDTGRLAAGLIATLPLGWSAAVDYSIGVARSENSEGGPHLDATYTSAIRRGEIDPLGNWADVVAATPFYLEPRKSVYRTQNNFSDANLRLAGPLLRAPGGPLTLTLLAERRGDHVPERVGDFGGERVLFSEYKQVVSSGYAELRAPLVPDDAKILRGLELQLAARYDDAATSFAPVPVRLEPWVDPLTTVNRSGFNYTVGARLYPLQRMMLRASVATGELYPAITQLRSLSSFRPVFPISRLFDPKRGGELIGGGQPVNILSGGSPSNKPELANTISVGVVLNPQGESGPRLSIDYSRVEIRREILPFSQTRFAVVANEEAYPGRLERGPLTDADARRGFTAGPVTELDLTDPNAGATIAEAVDIELDWRVPLAADSEVQFYGSGTWQPRLKQRRRAGQPWIDRVGYFEGPLTWRGNLGAEWTQGPLSVDINLQLFDGYRMTYGDPRAASEALISVNNAQALRYHGGERIPSQAYVDLAVRRRFEFVGRLGPLDAIQVRLGIQNVFDKRPPLIANDLEVPYSTYGDARRRRLELSVSSEF
jgi:outer membrane receptor protein involved in Fe transport